MRQEFAADFKKIKQMLADFSGVDPDELLITRNATEALNILIQGIPLKRGDEVMLQHHDYHSMIETYQMLERTRGIQLKFVDVPLVPKGQQEVVDLYLDAINDKTRCIHLTHLTHLTGQIIPVSKIAAHAREKGIDVIVDAAHSFAQLDYQLPDLDADFVGVNLHKWFSNPLGAGLLYVRKDRIREVSPLYGDHKKDIDNIDKLGHFGTPATPIVMTLSASGEFNDQVTIPIKEKRVRYLQNYWTSRARKIDRVVVTTPESADMSCALASFKIDGLDAAETVRLLDEKYGVFTVIRRLHNDEVIRVTPNLYNLTSELDQLLEGIEGLSKM